MAKLMKNYPSRKNRPETRSQLEWVAEQLYFIEAANNYDGGDETKRRSVFSLPRSLVHLLRLLALMEQSAPPASQRKIDAMMRRYLEDQIHKQGFASLNQMYSYAQD